MRAAARDPMATSVLFDVFALSQSVGYNAVLGRAWESDPWQTLV